MTPDSTHTAPYSRFTHRHVGFIFHPSCNTHVEESKKKNSAKSVMLPSEEASHKASPPSSSPQGQPLATISADSWGFRPHISKYHAFEATLTFVLNIFY